MMVQSAVPVLLFVFNRYERLEETLNAIEAAGIENLWVFADGSRTPEEKKKTDKVKALIEAIGWTEPRVYYQKKNIGLSQSIRSGLDLVFKEHDSAIIIEDDLIIAPNFYEYMCSGLQYYKDSQQVMGISGLRLPFDKKVFDSYEYDTYFSKRFASWGWATWRDKWNRVTFDRSYIAKKVYEKNIQLDSLGYDFYPMYRDAVLAQSLSGAWDVYCAVNMLINNQVFVMPVDNMIENTGLLNGTHFTANKQPKWAPKIEGITKNHGYKFAPVSHDTHEINEALVDFFNTSYIGENNTLYRAKHVIKRLLSRS